MSKSDTAGNMNSDSEKHPDGRRERTRASRLKIVNAMVRLIGEGHQSPSADLVAKTAGVGRRTVFRHFDDMDSLYGEMTDVVAALALPLWSKPLSSDNWRDQLRELAERRTVIFEKLLPYRMVTRRRRHSSAYLKQENQRLLKIDRNDLKKIVPSHILSDRIEFQSINAILGFHNWSFLRKEEGLSANNASAVVKQLLEDRLARIKD